MWLNDMIIWILVLFICIGGLDRIFGNRWGYGKAFEEGFLAMGPIALAMVGIISISPILAEVLRPVVTPVFTVLGSDPAMFPGMILAIDMGGYPLAMALAESEMAGLFSGIIMATLLGPTFVFTIPVALGIIKKHDRSIFAKGILIGLIPIPVGGLIGGLVGGMSVIFLWKQLLPVILFSCFIIIGLLWKQNVMIKGFFLFGKLVTVVITIGLVFSIVEALTGVTVIDGMVPLSEGVYIVGIIAITLAGAFPLVHFLKNVLTPILPPIAQKVKTTEMTFIGLISSLAHSIPMFKHMHEMDEKGKLMNVAFAVSGAFVLGGHLGFTASVESNMIIPMMVAKLSAGCLSVGIAFFLSNDPNI
ncbi:ethanolamine utilization protein EutH [Evansella tamaricis]|uniref:Ethanolamine utilization protein EutH n=1 Tax=Evansella tamaricis TaxID=2069301 RepID=A0ABS6JHL1_9BACI|nr:ethanolamine utilization protein EutH [Evansella tamaricis]MBU9713161.1 ethanolamine utilization protein EutH [Evansella tamaricis]